VKFIPGESILHALTVASLSNVTVRLLVPGISDSRLVNAAARSYYTELLKAGVEIYIYQKGFVHAKSVVVDNHIAIVGTANMDNRSFDLNFEVNTIVYDTDTAVHLSAAFDRDIIDAQKINPADWNARPLYKQFLERLARLLSPLL
jgi:cardiolipin synthase A/B